MPGMMDTILNLGLNDDTVEALAKKTGNPRFAWDCYRRFVQMYGDVVLGRAEAAGRRPRAVRNRHRGVEARAVSPGHRRHEADRRGSQGTGPPLQGSGQGSSRQEVPGVALGSVEGCGRRRVRIVDERPRDRLSPEIQHPDGVGHGRQRAGDGVRQHRRAIGIRRGVHTQPGKRGEGVLRRIPDQRAGRGRRRRRANARAGGGTEEADAERRIRSWNASGRRSNAISRTFRTSNSPSKTASSTCCRRATGSERQWPR